MLRHWINLEFPDGGVGVRCQKRLPGVDESAFPTKINSHFARRPFITGSISSLERQRAEFISENIQRVSKPES